MRKMSTPYNDGEQSITASMKMLPTIFTAAPPQGRRQR